MFKNKKVLIGIGVIVALILLFIIYKAVRGPEVSAKVAKVIREDIASTVSAPGRVKAKAVDLVSKAGGRIEQVMVKEGDYVTVGQIVVKMDGFGQAERDYERMRILFSQNFSTQQQLEGALQTLQSLSVFATISGTVTKVYSLDGEGATPGMPVVTIVDNSHPWIEFQIDEVDIGKVKKGDKVKIISDAYPDEVFWGKLNWFSAKAELKQVAGRVRMDEEDLVFRSKAEITEGKEKLKDGMSVYGDVVIDQKAGALVVPREAIVVRDSNYYVFVVGKNKRVKEKKIEIGIKNTTAVEILSGVEEGEDVVASNLDKLKEGIRVRPQS
ncbi:MAG: efflux RND transporter periplasmic adaptor subunit [Candidatus Saganbacteria bacterium]|nr:efflux RND transporter periplasmic adaptor subunit [Candidatus Saganbacteria bacterium]